MEQTSQADTRLHTDSPPRRLTSTGDAQLLKVYVYYRTLLSSILLLMFSSDIAGNILGTSSPRLFAYTAFSYALVNLLVLVLLWRNHFTPRTEQIVTILLMDIVAVVLLMHASNGMEGSLAYLLLICVAAGSIFLRGTASIALAGLSTILILSESIYSTYTGHTGDRAVFAAGIFGVLLFATAFAFGSLSERIRRSTQEALSQAEHAAYLQRLSQLIIERMRTGIVVVDKNDRVVMLNRAAKILVGLPEPRPNHKLAVSRVPSLSEHLTIWRKYPHTRSPHLKTRADGPEIRVSFAQMESGPGSDTLIFVEDNRSLSQQAQQLKLASLGRLTASIAHEVRNPLGAISHAAQLLTESSTVAGADKRLGEIIQNHSRRVNHIIENILQLSRRKAAVAEPVHLSEWLENFVHEYRLTKRSVDIDLELRDGSAKTRVDPSQLQQVLTNLCDNGLRYSLERNGTESLTLATGIDLTTELPYIEVIDDGDGIADEDVEQVFEPFFTTESTGSGLGLYISRELCEANQATLDYKRTEEGKSCFRINFAHPERVF